MLYYVYLQFLKHNANGRFSADVIILYNLKYWYGGILIS